MYLVLQSKSSFKEQMYSLLGLTIVVVLVKRTCNLKIFNMVRNVVVNLWIHIILWRVWQYKYLVAVSCSNVSFHTCQLQSIEAKHG